MQDVVSVKCSGVAHYKAIRPAGMGKALHRSLAQRTKVVEETLQDPGKCLWKQVSLIEMLHATFNSVKSDTVDLKIACQV